MQVEKIAIIGCGKQAEKHIGGYRANGMSDITVADIDPDVARSFANRMKVRYQPDVDTLIGSPRITAVDICTPTLTHYPLLLKTISTRKNFLVEKPLTETLNQAIDIAARTHAAGLVGAVGFTYRFVPDFAKIRYNIHNGDLGKINAAHFRIGGRGSHVLWKHQKHSGGGAIREMLVHMLDLAVWFFGPVETVQVLDVEQRDPLRIIQGHLHRVDAEDFVLVKLKMTAGPAIIISADFNTPSFVQYAEFQGAQGFAFGSIQPHLPSFIWRAESGGGLPGGKTCLPHDDRSIVADLISDFASALQGACHPRGPLSQAVEVQRVLEQVLQQVDSGRFAKAS